uniref:Uncharacterized protein n=1 Tax=Mastacembelus armatus TaxID=205130 RepID=A0A7N8XIP4_9TELE
KRWLRCPVPILFTSSQSQCVCSSSAQSEGAPCSTPVGAPHPVRGLLERFEAGPGCAARERGNKETHVIAVGRSTNSPGNKVQSPRTLKDVCESRNHFSLLVCAVGLQCFDLFPCIFDQFHGFMKD